MKTKLLILIVLLSTTSCVTREYARSEYLRGQAEAQSEIEKILVQSEEDFKIQSDHEKRLFEWLYQVCK